MVFNILKHIAHSELFELLDSSLEHLFLDVLLKLFEFWEKSTVQDYIFPSLLRFFIIEISLFWVFGYLYVLNPASVIRRRTSSSVSVRTPGTLKMLAASAPSTCLHALSKAISCTQESAVWLWNARTPHPLSVLALLLEVPEECLFSTTMRESCMRNWTCHLQRVGFPPCQWRRCHPLSHATLEHALSWKLLGPFLL